MSCYVSVKINSTEYETFEVPHPVYIYIKQLENAILSESSKEHIKELYHERFDNGHR